MLSKSLLGKEITEASFLSYYKTTEIVCLLHAHLHLQSWKLLRKLLHRKLSDVATVATSFSFDRFIFGKTQHLTSYVLHYILPIVKVYLPRTAWGETLDLMWLDLMNLKVKSEEVEVEEERLTRGRLCLHTLQLPAHSITWRSMSVLLNDILYEARPDCPIDRQTCLHGILVLVSQLKIYFKLGCRICRAPGLVVPLGDL